MARKKARMGRPPVEAAKRRSRFVTVRFTVAEYQRLAHDAATAGKTVAEYLRDGWHKQKGQ